MKFRYFFDWSRDFLWSADKDALDRYGYVVDPDQLPISAETKAIAADLASVWIELASARSEVDTAKSDAFNNRAQDLYERIVRELGSDFHVVNEHFGSSNGA